MSRREPVRTNALVFDDKFHGPQQTDALQIIPLQGCSMQRHRDFQNLGW
jgi:hypothetical protein